MNKRQHIHAVPTPLPHLQILHVLPAQPHVVLAVRQLAVLREPAFGRDVVVQENPRDEACDRPIRLVFLAKLVK